MTRLVINQLTCSCPEFTHSLAGSSGGSCRHVHLVNILRSRMDSDNQLSSKAVTNSRSVKSFLSCCFLPAAAGQVLLRHHHHHLQVTFTNLDPDSPGHLIHPNHSNHPNHLLFYLCHHTYRLVVVNLFYLFSHTIYKGKKS